MQYRDVYTQATCTHTKEKVWMHSYPSTCTFLSLAWMKVKKGFNYANNGHMLFMCKQTPSTHSSNCTYAHSHGCAHHTCSRVTYKHLQVHTITHTHAHTHTLTHTHTHTHTCTPTHLHISTSTVNSLLVLDGELDDYRLSLVGKLAEGSRHSIELGVL